MVSVFVQNKLHVNIVYFQFTAQNGSSIKGKYLYVGLQFTGQIQLQFTFDNDQNKQVKNWTTSNLTSTIHVAVSYVIE